MLGLKRSFLFNALGLFLIVLLSFRVVKTHPAKPMETFRTLHLIAVTFDILLNFKAALDIRAKLGAVLEKQSIQNHLCLNVFCIEL